MLDLICIAIEKIVFSNANGVIMIPILIWALSQIPGQVIETIEVFKEV